MKTLGSRTLPFAAALVALTMAPATFPLATDVNATDDWTVEGTRQRKKKPA